MRLRVLACQPRVATPPDGLDADLARLVHLPFHDWLALEGERTSAAYDRLERRYTAHPPSFWEWWMDVDPALITGRSPEQTRALGRAASPDLETLVAALHWYTGIAPIDPRRSVTYFDAPPHGDGTPRVCGESEKEYATENREPHIVLTGRDARPLAEMAAFAQRTRAVWTSGPYRHALHSLALSSTPGLGWPARVLLLVGAFEALLLSDTKQGLQKAFAERFAALVARSDNSLPEWTTWMGLAYRLRSDLVHGRPTAATVARLPAAPDAFATQLERAGVVALCRLLGEDASVHQWDVEEASC